MRSLDDILVSELVAIERSAGAGEQGLRLIGVAIALARLGEHCTLLRLAAPLLCWRGEDQSFGALYQAGRAIASRLALSAGPDLDKLVHDELIFALGREHARRERLAEQHFTACRENARLQTEKDRLRARLRSAELQPAPDCCAGAMREALLRHYREAHPDEQTTAPPPEPRPYEVTARSPRAEL